MTVIELEVKPTTEGDRTFLSSNPIDIDKDPDYNSRLVVFRNVGTKDIKLTFKTPQDRNAFNNPAGLSTMITIHAGGELEKSIQRHIGVIKLTERYDVEFFPDPPAPEIAFADHGEIHIVC